MTIFAAAAAFNSLYEIPYSRVDTASVFAGVFQFSLWDSWSLSSYNNCLCEVPFNSLYEILIVRVAWKPLLSPNTFNSLYEIRHLWRGYIQHRHRCSFQFSLWDSGMGLQNAIVFRRLSILFMRFEMEDIRDDVTRLKYLSILFMRFGGVAGFLTLVAGVFQFSLWDSWRIRWKKSNSYNCFQFSLWDSAL